MKKLLIVFLLCIYTLPIPIKAGITCADGWESSCVFPGPGCCSHHGGILDGDSSYKGNYYGGDSFWDRLNNGEYAGHITILIFLAPFIVTLFSSLKEKFAENLTEENPNDKNKIVEDKKIFIEAPNNYVEHTNSIIVNETKEEIFTCEACGIDVKENAIFCPGCGAKFEEEEELEEEKTYTCGACGAEVSNEDTECPECGAKFEEEELEEEKTYTCGACGAEVSNEDTECPECGAKFEEE